MPTSDLLPSATATRSVPLLISEVAVLTPLAVAQGDGRAPAFARVTQVGALPGAQRRRRVVRPVQNPTGDPVEVQGLQGPGNHAPAFLQRRALRDLPGSLADQDLVGQ